MAGKILGFGWLLHKMNCPGLCIFFGYLVQKNVGWQIWLVLDWVGWFRLKTSGHTDSTMFGNHKSHVISVILLFGKRLFFTMMTIMKKKLLVKIVRRRISIKLGIFLEIRYLDVKYRANITQMAVMLAKIP